MRPLSTKRSALATAALIACAIALLGMSSAAWSSAKPQKKSAASLGLDKAQVDRIIARTSKGLQVRACRPASEVPLPCVRKNGRGPTGKVKRSYFNTKDASCPIWEVKKPWSVWATVATQADVWCIKGIAGHDIGGGGFLLSQSPEIAFLSLDGPGGRHWSTSSGLNDCGVLPYDTSVFVLHIEWVELCHAHMGVHAPVFPPGGKYRGLLGVLTYHPIWTNNAMLDVSSETLCYFC